MAVDPSRTREGHAQELSGADAGAKTPQLAKSRGNSDVPAQGEPNPPPVQPPPPTAQTHWLFGKDMPVGLTVLLALLGWCAIHAVDTIEDSPTVDYVRSIKRQEGGAYNVTFRVTNVSLKHFFRGVSFYIKDHDGSFTKLNATAIPPAKEVQFGNPEPENISPAINGLVSTCRYFVAQFQPATSWDFSAILNTDSKPDPQLSADFSPLLDNNPYVTVDPVSIRVVRHGIETILVRYKVEILFIAAVIWVVMAVLYILAIENRRRRT
jgi:hypothetical protein